MTKQHLAEVADCRAGGDDWTRHNKTDRARIRVSVWQDS